MIETGFDAAFLAIAILAALDYAFRHSFQPPNRERSATKTTAILALIIWAAAKDVPDAILLGLGFSVLADFAMSRNGRMWLMRAAYAFLLTQLAYMLAYSSLSPQFDVTLLPALLMGYVTTILAYLVYGTAIRQSAMAGALHVIVLLVQFTVAMMVSHASVLFGLAGALFMLSGHVLALELSLLDEDARERRFTGPFIYLSYFLGQIALVLGFIPFDLPN